VRIDQVRAELGGEARACARRPAADPGPDRLDAGRAVRPWPDPDTARSRDPPGARASFRDGAAFRRLLHRERPRPPRPPGARRRARRRLPRAYLAPPPRVSVWEWAEQYRHIAKGPERGRGATSARRTWWSRWSARRRTALYEQVVLMFATQMGKTEVLYNALLQRIHTEPQDMMMVQPTLQDAQDHSSKRFLPTVLATPMLRGWWPRRSRATSPPAGAAARSRATSRSSSPAPTARVSRIEAARLRRGRRGRQVARRRRQRGPAARPARGAHEQLRAPEAADRVDVHVKDASEIERATWPATAASTSCRARIAASSRSWCGARTRTTASSG
jgi:hypothetical protein